MMAVYNLLILQTRTRDVQTQEWRERSYDADHERYGWMERNAALW